MIMIHPATAVCRNKPGSFASTVQQNDMLYDDCYLLPLARSRDKHCQDKESPAFHAHGIAA